MTEVTNELMYEVLKQIQDRLTALESKADEIKSELQAVRVHFLAMQHDIQNIYSILTRHDTRLDRIERRLEIAEAPA